MIPILNGSGHKSHKRKLDSKIYLAVNAHGMPVKMFVTQGTTADCAFAGQLIEGISAEQLPADRAYDSDGLVAEVAKRGMNVVIPLRKKRKVQREHDSELCKFRYLMENAFLHLKRWRGMATRYAKNSTSFPAAAFIR